MGASQNVTAGKGQPQAVRCLGQEPRLTDLIVMPWFRGRRVTCDLLFYFINFFFNFLFSPEQGKLELLWLCRRKTVWLWRQHLESESGMFSLGVALWSEKLKAYCLLFLPFGPSGLPHTWHNLSIALFFLTWRHIAQPLCLWSDISNRKWCLCVAALWGGGALVSIS